MLLIVPTWFGGASGEMALLGFGDVVLPGLLLVYTRIFDLQYHRGLCCGYFVPASVGYGLGLILTYGALYFQLGGDQVRRLSPVWQPCCVFCDALHPVTRPYSSLQLSQYCSKTLCKERSSYSLKMVIYSHCRHILFLCAGMLLIMSIGHAVMLWTACAAQAGS